MSKKTGTYRNFAFELWKESLPEDWKTLLGKTGLPIAYIWHDRDVYTEEDYQRALEKVEAGEREPFDWKPGDIKKEHAHVLVHGGSKDSPKSVKRMLEILGPLGVKHVEVLDDYKAYARYMIHQGWPDKAQYSPAEIVKMNGIKFPDLEELPDLSRNQKLDVKIEILDMIDERRIGSYSALVRWCRKALDGGGVEARLRLEMVINQSSMWQAYMNSLKANQEGHFRRFSATAEDNSRAIELLEKDGVDDDFLSGELEAMSTVVFESDNGSAEPALPSVPDGELDLFLDESFGAGFLGLDNDKMSKKLQESLDLVRGYLGGEVQVFRPDEPPF